MNVRYTDGKIAGNVLRLRCLLKADLDFRGRFREEIKH